PKQTTKYADNHTGVLPLGLLLLCLLLGTGLRGQDVSQEFKDKAAALIKLRPKTYGSLDKEFGSEKQDTTLLRYFAMLSQQYDYPEGQSYALNQIATKYRNISQFQKSAELHQQALELAETANNTELRVLSLNMLGVVYRRTDAI